MPSPSTLETPAPAGRHALIIEDDLITGLDIQAMLQPLGYGSFAFASTADQAAEQARLRAPDLTTVDLGLLDGDGLAAARAVENVCGRVATIFITGDPVGVTEGGENRLVLSKPFSAVDLRRAVEAIGSRA